jgi:EAL domain-containing protein (putative c-di-GMP-specific phosphodiesterase class I)
LRGASTQERQLARPHLEVTESEVIAVALVHEIAMQRCIYGIALSIDDFGEGYSSFARLRDLPFCELKLSSSFVQGH